MLFLRRLARSVNRASVRTKVAVRRHPRTWVAVVLIGLVVVMSGGAFLSMRATAAPATAPTSGPTFTYAGGWSLVELQRHVEAGDVSAITAIQQTSSTGQTTDGLLVRTRDGQIVPVNLSVSAGDAVAALTSLGYGNLMTAEAIGVSQPPDASRVPSVISIVLPIVLMLFVGLLIWRISRRGHTAQRDSSSAFKTIMPVPLGSGEVTADPAAIRLSDVAGCDEAKLELTESIEFLRSPERFQKLGARIPRGVMLYGPPGTGKTMLARAVAAEAGVPFHYASGSEFVEKYVGVGARRIRDLFAQARKLGRGVIFFDEFDALGKSRGGPNSHEEREQTLNQLLVELDGFGTTDGVIVIAATNRVDTLDSAVLRPGRFSRKVHVGLPDVAGRQAILDVHSRNKPMGATADLAELARKTYGFSGAMLADLLNEAAIMAARRSAETIEPEDLHSGWLKVAVGTSRRRSMDQRERSIIAAHEVGHAICSRIHGDKRRVEEISLFAHGEALGVTVSSQEDNDLPAESDLRARLVALMGGRAAEELLFQEVTGGASNDFDAANRIAVSMVTKWGMGRDPESRDGGVSGRGSLSFLVPIGGHSLPTDVQAATTRAIRAILDEAYAEACRTLIEHIETLRRLAAYLVEHERLDGLTFDELFDGRRVVPNPDDEWRAATSRPRAWGEVVDLAARRSVPAPQPVAVAAAAGAPAPLGDPAGDGAAAPALPPAVVLPDPLFGAAAIAPPADLAEVSRGRWRRRTRDGAFEGRPVGRAPLAVRRIRRSAASMLRRVEAWVRESETEGGRL